MRNEKQLSFSAQNVFLCAITHFFSINDITINRKKIKKFMSEAENKYEYRSYLPEEIKRLLTVSDERERAIILLLSSTGMRVGAVHPLRLKDLKKWIIDKRGTYVYQIQVYSFSSKSKYFTYCTPECALAIDRYLDTRKLYGEDLTKTDTGWGPSNRHLIIRAFNRKCRNYIPIPLKSRSTITSNIMVPKLESIGLRPRSTEDVNCRNKIQFRSELHPCHSFRIFAITQMQRSRLDKTIREMLVGHATGLDSVYYKATEEEIFQEYLKAIDNLTIEENRIQYTKDKIRSKENEILVLKEKYASDLISIREDMNQKFNQIFYLIQMNPNLANIKPEILQQKNSKSFMK